jgi:hypothetical protein
MVLCTRIYYKFTYKFHITYFLYVKQLQTGKKLFEVMETLSAQQQAGLDGQCSIPSRNKSLSLLYSTQTGSGVIQLPIQWTLGALTLGVKIQGHTGDPLICI